MTSSLEIVALATAAIAAGAINAVAGGGTLLTFPALIAVLGGDAATASVVANATSTVALFPGSLAAMAGYRRELWQTRSWAALLMLPSLLGGIAGALLVTELPPESFQALVPWLILTAAVLFAIQPAVTRRLGLGGAPDAMRPRNVPLVAIFQLLVAVYGGYFGAGIGILMLTALAVMGLRDIHEMNALKTLLASAINGVAVVVFIAQGAVHWRLASLMAISAVAGGYAGAHVARRVDRAWVRRVVVVIGFSLTAFYLWKQRT